VLDPTSYAPVTLGGLPDREGRDRGGKKDKKQPAPGSNAHRRRVYETQPAKPWCAGS